MLRSTSNTNQPPKWTEALHREMQMALGGGFEMNTSCRGNYRTNCQRA